MRLVSSAARAGAFAMVPLAALAALLAGRAAPSCAPDNGGLTLPDGFCASAVATGVDAVRHLAVAPSGDLYAAASGSMLRGGVAAFRDRDGDGTIDERTTFGPRGTNDVAVHDGYLYVAMARKVVRWKLTPGQLEPAGEPETIVTDLPGGGDHGAKTIALPGGNVLLVKIGSASNSCQQSNRAERSPGRDPCVELETRAGIWRFAADRPNQAFTPGNRWATGLRNAEAIGVQPGTGLVWAAVHGRDQLGGNWGFSDEANANNPAEELVQVSQGDDIGWPYCFYSNDAKKKVLAPEYGGDGRTVGRCATAKAPAIAFPGHWAPQCARVLSGRRVRRGVHRRAVHHLPRQLEPRAAAAGRLPGGVRAVRRRQADGHIPDVRHAQGRSVPADGSRGGEGRGVVPVGRRQRHDLADREALTLW